MHFSSASVVVTLSSSKLRTATVDEFSVSKVVEILSNPEANLSNFPIVKIDKREISFDLSIDINKSNFGDVATQSFETQCAEKLYKALEPVRQADPNLLFDPRIWAFINLYPMREYNLARWCDGVGLFGKTLPAEMPVGYFFTKRGDLKGHTRCGARRLYIAAHACQASDGNLNNLSKFFSDTDLYTQIFERRMSLDSELALALAIKLETLSRAERRFALRSVQLMLATISLEYLNRQRKESLIDSALSDYQNR